MLTFRFRRSRSNELPWLIELAKRGTFVEQALSPQQIVYETRFDLLDPLQLGYALSLATALVHDKKAEVFAAGQSLKLPMVREVLRCFQQSQQTDDHHAYCWFRMVLSGDPTGATYTVDLSGAKSFIFPCRQAATHSLGVNSLQPGQIEDQVEAALLRGGTRWCPRLADLTEWRHAQLIQINRGTT